MGRPTSITADSGVDDGTGWGSHPTRPVKTRTEAKATMTLTTNSMTTMTMTEMTTDQVSCLCVMRLYDIC